MGNHLDFLELADQWLITYSTNISNMPAPTLFIIGHCFEAYCKSAIAKHDESIDLHKKFGHKIEDMINYLKDNVGLMKYLNIEQGIENFMTNGPVPLSLPPDQQIIYNNYIENQELYWVMKFLKDLKYIGTKGKTMPTQYSILVMERNPYWINILKEIRDYICKNENPYNLSINNFSERQNIEFAKEYINKII